MSGENRDGNFREELKGLLPRLAVAEYCGKIPPDACAEMFARTTESGVYSTA